MNEPSIQNKFYSFIEQTWTITEEQLNELKDEPELSSINSISKNYQELWENHNKDFKIEIGNDGNVMVHKLVISARSTYFEGMLKSGMKETITNSVKIIDFKLNTVKICKIANGSIYSNSIKLRQICFDFLMICLKHSIAVENLQNLDNDFAAELFLKAFSPFD
uniref:BTB domain-containing protein n=1 Tax=Panagrolaimus sp. PS1159 TaxID=55785 RepID=A0AC35FCB4_9BILA